MKKTILVAAVGLIALACQAQILDAIRFGDAESEKAHNFTGEESAVVQGAYNTTGRKLLKPETESWQTAPMRFRLKVDPAAKNYITVKFWGGDVTHDHLVMFIDNKQMGYVGNCGESTIRTSADCYEATIDRRTGKGDPEIFRTMEQAALARTIFRYPGVTVDNHPVMRLEVYIDWRNAHFPGEPSYVGKGLDLRTIYYTGNEKLLGCFKEMLADGYFQENVAASLRPGKRPDFIGLLHLPERYMEIVKKLGRVNSGMPMRGEDFVFTDEEIGVVALRNGSDVFFAELFWRARRGISNLAKIHMVTPTAEHIATVHQEQEFIPSGKFSTEPDWVVYGFRPNRFNYPGGYYRQLRAGTRIPQAEHADDQICIGKAEFYRCSYGPYEIAMNATRRNQSYRFPVPAGNYRILPDGPTVEGGTVLEVKPGTTVVLYKQAK